MLSGIETTTETSAAMALDTVLSEYADFCPVCTEMAVLRWSDSDLDERICDGCAECLVEAEHVFGLCHLLGFRFAPRLSDLAERRLYVAEGHADHGGLDSLIGGVINLSKIEENWDETLRVTASIRAGTVAFSASAPASITLLSRIIDLLRECRPAKGTAPGRSQQPRPDRFQDLLQRQTRSFFLPQGKLSG